MMALCKKVHLIHYCDYYRGDVGVSFAGANYGLSLIGVTLLECGDAGSQGVPSYLQCTGQPHPTTSFAELLLLRYKGVTLYIASFVYLTQFLHILYTYSPI